MRSTDQSEEWRPVVGYEGIYEISNLARVRSLDRIVKYHNGADRFKEGRVLNPQILQGRRRIYYDLRHPDFGRRNKMVHRLIAEAFIPNPDNLPVVRHLNDVPDDNRINNLAWGTHSDNRYDAVRNGSHPFAGRSHCKRGHPFTEENTYRHRGRRNCRECSRVRKREMRKKNGKSVRLD